MFEAIIGINEKYPLKEKVLISQSFEGGRQLLRTLASMTGGFLNFQATTISSLVSYWASPLLAKAGLSPIEACAGSLLVQELADSKGYYARCVEQPGLAQAIWQTLQELRLRDISADRVKNDLRQHQAKAGDLARFLIELPKFLKERGLADGRDILDLALKNATAIHPKTIILVEPGIYLAPLEKKFLETLASEKIVYLEESAQKTAIWSSLISGNGEPPEANKGHLQTFVADHPAAELQEILRRARLNKENWDQTEICLVAPDEQWPLLKPLMVSQEIPFTLSFTERFDRFRPGRVAFQLCEWAENEFPAEILVGLLEQNDLSFFVKKPADEEKSYVSSYQAGAIIRDSNAVRGRNGYSEPLKYLAEEHQDRSREKNVEKW